MFMKYSIALTLVKGLSPKKLNQVYELDQNENDITNNLSETISYNIISSIINLNDN